MDKCSSGNGYVTVSTNAWVAMQKERKKRVAAPRTDRHDSLTKLRTRLTPTGRIGCRGYAVVTATSIKHIRQ